MTALVFGFHRVTTQVVVRWNLVGTVEMEWMFP